MSLTYLGIHILFKLVTNLSTSYGSAFFVYAIIGGCLSKLIWRQVVS